MRRTSLLRLLLLLMAVTASVVLFSYSRQSRKATGPDMCTESHQSCDDKKMETESIIVESLFNYLLSAR